MTDSKICESCQRPFAPLWHEKKCYPCICAQYAASLKRNIQEGMVDSTWCESEIHCPWCGESLGEAADCELPMLDGATKKMYCRECGKEFLVTVNCTITYDTRRPSEPC